MNEVRFGPGRIIAFSGGEYSDLSDMSGYLVTTTPIVILPR
jgi:hypothetical protein